jgi:hypothetical protein
MKLLIMEFLQPPITLSFFGPNILLSTLLSNTLSLCSSLNVRDQVSHPYRSTAKIIVHFSDIHKNIRFVAFVSSKYTCTSAYVRTRTSYLIYIINISRIDTDDGDKSSVRNASLLLNNAMADNPGVFIAHMKHKNRARKVICNSYMSAY